ncbi:L-type lectin family protein [Companilactobacillus hulinensis]|uniref:lectin-like domain-containing protein n=1 Tax=Companilactobacillus hulinensis TaxID=2486007 RepID=UPI000F773677|nr:hypothetical protein [Companilactobacillus hulinensis]
MGKYKKINKLLCTFFVIIAAITTTIAANNYINVNADTTSGDPNDLANALATAPRGLDISDPTFRLGEFHLNNYPQYNVNASKVIKRNQGVDDKTGILRVTNDFGQLGAIWSNIDEANYIDISRDQTMSMWLYFGRPIDSTRPKEVGDGMAFVLQNDDRGIGAISTFKGDPAYGETLGVWGADFDNENSEVTNATIAGTSIQKSYAIEFDTFANNLVTYGNLNGKGVSFDAGMITQHIGMNYPDVPGTYTRQDVNNMVPYRHYFSMHHTVDMKNMNLTDATWHHMTVKFEHATHTLSFDYDDKNLDGTYKAPDKSASTVLDMDHFKLGDSQKLRWGFTGSTGQYMENNLIVFESIPSFVSADTSASIKNVTKNYTIGAGDHVDIGDNLDFTYNLNYESGSKEWSDILASMNLPSEVTFHSGSVIYNDNAGDVEEIPFSEYSNNNVQHLLSKDLSDTNKKATIVLHTTVNSVDRQTDVKESLAKFSSDNFIINDQTPNFVIDVDALNISTDPSGTVNYGSLSEIPDTIPVTGNIWYSKVSTINPATIKVKSSFNGGATVTTSATGIIGATAPFSLSIDKSQLHIGQNTLTLYGQDNAGKRTKEVTIIFNVGGGLSFGKIATDVFFKDVHLGYKGEIVPRKPGWQIEVIDGRSTRKGWTLQARATSLVDEKTSSQLIGEIVHRNDSGTVSPLLNWTDIYSHVKDTDDVETFDVANAWTQNNGVLLQLNGKNKAGSYSGKMEWNLLDSI